MAEKQALYLELKDTTNYNPDEMNLLSVGDILNTFPRLDKHGFELFFLTRDRFNCLAYCLGYKDRFILPVNNDYSKKNIIKIFNSFGYKVCKSQQYEDNCRKVLFYGHGKSLIMHAGLVCNDKVLSKLGNSHLILHNPHDLVGKIYGNIMFAMKMKP